jgi:RES domain-containing protein
MKHGYRIGDNRFKIYSPKGAEMLGGRWNSPGKGVIYASETYSLAMMEKLIHTNRSSPPKGHEFVVIEIPDSVSTETVDTTLVAGWNDEDMTASRAFGDKWFDDKRSAILRVPSAVTQGPEMNLVINPDHPDHAHVKDRPPRPVIWDPRLFLKP